MTAITDEYMQQMLTTAETGVKGLGIFNASLEETKKIMDGDRAVQAGVFVYEIHPCRSFPGDSLPG